MSRGLGDVYKRQVLTDVRNEIRLSLEVNGLTAGMKVICGAAETDVAQGIDIRSLTTEAAGGFVGCTVGLYAVSKIQTQKAAVYKNFIYKTQDIVVE